MNSHAFFCRVYISCCKFLPRPLYLENKSDRNSYDITIIHLCASSNVVDGDVSFITQYHSVSLWPFWSWFFNKLCLHSFLRISSSKNWWVKPPFLPQIHPESPGSSVSDIPDFEIFRGNPLACRAFGALKFEPLFTKSLIRPRWFFNKLCLSSFSRNSSSKNSRSITKRAKCLASSMFIFCCLVVMVINPFMAFAFLSKLQIQRIVERKSLFRFDERNAPYIDTPKNHSNFKEPKNLLFPSQGLNLEDARP